ncbi:MAG TPA: capsular biosynthesis protein [Clostridiales bacterium]|nr:capsular biosynthesis protein [Clostridiales bacterium]
MRGDESLIDIHAHILPLVDDGAKSAIESLSLCETALKNSIEAIVATPHFNKYEEIKKKSQLRDERISELQTYLDTNKCPISIYPGFEVYCGEEIAQVTDFSDFTINKSRYMLCEFDFFEPDALVFMQIIDHIVKCGVVPIIAHPERYKAFLEDYESLNYIRRWGALYQLNAGSFTGAYGRGERRLAITMLQCGFCDFIATDAHSIHSRSTNLKEMLIDSQIDFASGELDIMTVHNPRRILENEEITDIKRGFITYDALD